MPRGHTIWLRKQTGWRYVKIDGKQVKLSPDKAEAERAMHALLACLNWAVEQGYTSRPRCRWKSSTSRTT